MTTGTGGRPLRADAQRNRDRLLDAAREAFRNDDAEVSLEGIARAAGVGIGTLYRNFPTRFELLMSLYEEDLDRLLAASQDTSVPAATALEAWVEHLLEFTATKRALVQEMLEATTESPALADVRSRIWAAAEMLVTRGQRDGDIRTDIDHDDFLRLVCGINASRTPPSREQASRLAAVVLNGIRPQRSAHP